MKTSLAQTFDDLGERQSTDRLFPDNDYNRSITDDKGASLDRASVLVVKPYRGRMAAAQASAKVLVNEGMRSKYEGIIKGMEASKDKLLEYLKSKSGIKDGVEEAMLRDFGRKNKGVGAFFELLGEIAGLNHDEFTELRGIEYAMIDNTQVEKLLSDPDFKAHHSEYVSNYNRLLAESPYLTPDFDHTGAATACSQLEKTSFFKADHQVRLVSSKDKKPCDLADPRQFKAVIDAELGRIDNKSRPLWDKIDKKMSRNQQARDLRAAALKNPRLRLELGDHAGLRKKLWRAYISEKAAEIGAIVSKYREDMDRIKEIAKRARKEKNDWDRVVEKYNKRFKVPFSLSVDNKVDALLGVKMPILLFTFKNHDGKHVTIAEDKLPEILSEGEDRARYMLNILFAIEGIIKEHKSSKAPQRKETVIIVDDMADSFDYKNKHAITLYLKEISEYKFFHLVILTHNFDFFRTVCRQIVKYDRCYYVGNDGGDLRLFEAKDILDPLKYFVDHMHERKKFISCIPFARSILGYTCGTDDPDYTTLSSILHYREGTDRVKAKIGAGNTGQRVYQAGGLPPSPRVRR